ncbi:hypothetical protein QUF56_11275 [Ureibacillus composti]|nr:hypothetical protein [Ureibacillus composti]
MLVKGNTLPKVYWLLIIPIMLLTSYQNLFKFGKVQHYHIDELEYYGRILFYLITSFAESIIYIVFIWLVISIVKKVAEKWGISWMNR